MNPRNAYFIARIGSRNEITVERYLSSSRENKDKEENLSVSRNWMEYVEKSSDHNHPSAYDVVRCDIIQKKGSKISYKIWGMEFHLNRLEQSYLVLLNHFIQGDDQFTQDKTKDRFMLGAQKGISEARSQSESMINELLKSFISTKNNLANETENFTEYENTVFCEILKVTLLWSPPNIDPSSLTKNVLVRGHCSSSGQIIEPHRLPDSITATLALPDLLNEVISIEEMPDRHISPNSKISSWSSRRRPLEEIFMPNGIGEVLLLQLQEINGTKCFKILEGLTSNFFAIYKDGTIRTESNRILYGYVRHLVLEVAKECGLTIDTTNPILLEHANEWEECFITSSSRLIYPIKKILMPDYTQCDTEKSDLKWKLFWEEKPTVSQRWKHIYQSILKVGGYT